MEKQKLFGGENLWRILTYIWTWIYLFFIILNFGFQGRYNFLVATFSVLYVGVLTLYVGTKEFDRWYDTHAERHPGEYYVIVWTITMVGLVLAALILGEGYELRSDIVATYIAVLSIYAVTQKSKRLYAEKHHERGVR